MDYSKIEVYILIVDKNGFRIDKHIRNNVIDSIALKLSAIGGGCTIIDGKGYYINDKGILTAEYVSIAYTYTQDTTYNRDLTKDLLTYCEQLAYTHSQESWLVIVDNRTYFLLPRI